MRAGNHHLWTTLFGLCILLAVLPGCRPATPTSIPATVSPAATVKPSVTPLPATPTAQSSPQFALQSAVFRGNAQRTGVYALQGDYGEWSFPAGGPVASSPVLAGNTLYFATITGTFYALDPSTRQVKWQVTLPAGVFSSPAVAGEMLYFGGLNGTLYALQAGTGKQAWKFQAQGQIISSPAVAEGRVYFGDARGTLYALEAGSGKEVWKVATSSQLISSPLVADGLVLVGGSDSFLYALDAATGNTRWMYLAENPIQASPAVADGVVFITSAAQSDTNSGYAIDLKTGKAIWKAPAGNIAASPAVVDGVIYGANLDGYVMAAGVQDGSPVWDFQNEAPVLSSPAVSQDQVVFGDGAGKVHALDRRSGKEIWSFQTDGEIWSSPAIAGDTIFIGSADGNLYALNRRGPQLVLAPTATPLPLQPTPTMLPEPPQPPQMGTNGLPWWNDRVFYEVFLRSFKDSNGDGNGDLPGLIEKLDYLNDGDPNTTSDLGVTGLWLMPVMESPSYHGYDVIDYRQVEQDYGSNADFKKLLEEAHRRGIAVILDMVMNHTSNLNPWFLQSAYPGSKYENWYIWSPTKPDYLSPWGSEVWYTSQPFDFTAMRAFHTLHDSYYALFWSGMPDLNYRNGAVTQEMFDILRFWLQDMNVDGLRLDAVRHLIEDGSLQENTPETHAWLANFDNYVHTVKPDAFTVGEIWDDTAAVAPYVPDEVDTAFEFKLQEAIVQSINAADKAALAGQMAEVLKSYPDGQFATFLDNHDMTRVLTQLGDDPQKARLAAAILLASPGVPFIYYGDEIGLTGAKPDDVDLRRPMQWDNSPSAGFTSGTPWVAPGTHDPTANVATQTDDPDSLLSLYRTLIALRQEHPALRAGDTWLVESSAPQVYSLLRQSEDGAILFLANLSDQPIKGYQLTLGSGPLPVRVKASLLFGEGAPASPAINPQGGFRAYTPLAEIPPYGFAIIALQ